MRKDCSVSDTWRKKNALQVPALMSMYFSLKAKKTHGFNSCIVISVYILDTLSIEKATEYRND